MKAIQFSECQQTIPSISVIQRFGKREIPSTWFWVVRERDELGRALLFASKDLINWERVSIMSKAKNLKEEGYMWECPDFFHLDGQDVLLMSPQGWRQMEIDSAI